MNMFVEKSHSFYSSPAQNGTSTDIFLFAVTLWLIFFRKTVTVKQKSHGQKM